MISGGRGIVVLLGMLTKMPVAGVVWQNLHYLLGFRRLGYEVFYVETHARVPSMLMQREDDDASALAAAFIDSMLRPFDLGSNWAYVVAGDEQRCFGLSRPKLSRIYDSAAMIINLHGGTAITPELASTGRLVYLETDPVQLQLELAEGIQASYEFLEPHGAFFTFAEQLGAADCGLPLCERFSFHPTRQPVVRDLWATDVSPRPCLTTIGNWLQEWRDVSFQGETYTWSKGDEFRKVLTLPARTGASFELALASYRPEDRSLLRAHGWSVRPGMAVSTDPVRYRSYVQRSLAEFTVAKDQNVRFRTGWFSDRSATYLAAGRPVVTQDTGFGGTLPTGAGLHSFSGLDDAVAAVERVVGDYPRQAAAAREVAEEYFDSGRVLSAIVEVLGLGTARSATPPAGAAGEGDRAPRRAAFSDELVIEPVTRWPTCLPETTVTEVLNGEPSEAPVSPPGPLAASVIVPTWDNLVFLRLCLESLLDDPASRRYEVVVVDNGCRDGSREYLRALAQRHPNLRSVELEHNLGFARAVNIGVRASSADRIVLLNDDTIIPRGALERLLAHLDDARVGLVGACTNRSGDEAELAASYRTYGELQRFAAEVHGGSGSANDGHGESGPARYEVGTLALFCGALRRSVYDACQGLDEGYGVGLFEDDDLCMRIHGQGLCIAVAADAFVHHFGQASIGKLAGNGDYGRLFHANRRRFERTWKRPWATHARRPNPAYEQAVDEVREVLALRLRAGAQFAIVSAGDEGLVTVEGLEGKHFPADVNGGYVGYHPADDREAISAVERELAEGTEYLVVPFATLWWLEHYRELATWLRSRFRVIEDDPTKCVVFELREPGQLCGSLEGNYEIKGAR